MDGDRRLYQHPWRRISENKWKEAREWSLARIKNPRFDTKRLRQTTGPTPAKAPKRIAARFYQLKTGHALTATHLKWVKLLEDDQCWWCCRSRQTREHLFKNCNRWRAQHKAMWARVEKDTKRKWRMAEVLFADERCDPRGPPDYGRGQKGPVEKAETEKTESGAEQECPRASVCGLCGIHFLPSNFPNLYFLLCVRNKTR